MDEHAKGGELPPTEDSPAVSYPDDPESGLPPDAQPAPPPALQSKLPPPPPPPPDDWDPYAEDEEGMLRMSFMEHLDELRMRIIRSLIGAGAAFLLCIIFAIPIWDFVQAPLKTAISQIPGGEIIAIDPMEQFQIIWMWSPLVVSIFLAAPWVIYQVWAFVAPGLYPRERRWAAPFIIVTAGLFVAGGAFAYFVAFRYALAFLLSIGAATGVAPKISIDRYFGQFVNVILGVSLVFELPVVVFFLTLLRIVTPAFLMRNARYAVLIIIVLAAIVTPTPDVVNMTLFVVPMLLLYFLGVFASYLLVLHREGQKFPWKAFFIWLGAVVLIAAAVASALAYYYGYRVVPYWPFLVK